MILIIGSYTEVHAKYIAEKLIKAGEEVAFYDSSKAPEDILINWYPSTTDFNKGYFKIDNKKLYFSDIKSVYWRNFNGYSQKTNTKNYYAKKMLDREIESAYNSVFSATDWLWVNSKHAIELHKEKSYQLFLMAKNGIRVPKTLITNDTEELTSFIEENNNNVIFKPVRGGAYTKKISEETVTKKMVEALIHSPVQFQECVDGVDIRVYCIGKKLFSAKINAKTLDFRVDTNAEITPFELPQNIQEDCFKIMDLLDLKFTGIDIRLSNKGEYVFIEANPSPMFIGFEKKTGFPISDSLIELLKR